MNADKIILLGVGHFEIAMKNINKLDFINMLNEEILVKHKPILDICLSMQLMANNCEEGYVSGLDWIEAEVIKLKTENKLKYNIPHVGLNQIIKSKENYLMKGIP